MSELGSGQSNTYEVFNVKQISELLNEAVRTDGGHHKQWYLVQIATALHIEIGNDHEPGIAP